MSTATSSSKSTHKSRGVLGSVKSILLSRPVLFIVAFFVITKFVLPAGTKACKKSSSLVCNTTKLANEAAHFLNKGVSIAAKIAGSHTYMTLIIIGYLASALLSTGIFKKVRDTFFKPKVDKDASSILTELRTALKTEGANLEQYNKRLTRLKEGSVEGLQRYTKLLKERKRRAENRLKYETSDSDERRAEFSKLINEKFDPQPQIDSVIIDHETSYRGPSRDVYLRSNGQLLKYGINEKGVFAPTVVKEGGPEPGDLVWEFKNGNLGWDSTTLGAFERAIPLSNMMSVQVTPTDVGVGNVGFKNLRPTSRGVLADLLVKTAPGETIVIRDFNFLDYYDSLTNAQTQLRSGGVDESDLGGLDDAIKDNFIKNENSPFRRIVQEAYARGYITRAIFNQMLEGEFAKGTTVTYDGKSYKYLGVDAEDPTIYELAADDDGSLLEINKDESRNVDVPSQFPKDLEDFVVPQKENLGSATFKKLNELKTYLKNYNKLPRDVLDHISNLEPRQVELVARFVIDKKNNDRDAVGGLMDALTKENNTDNIRAELKTTLNANREEFGILAENEKVSILQRYVDSLDAAILSANANIAYTQAGGFKRIMVGVRGTFMAFIKVFTSIFTFFSKGTQKVVGTVLGDEKLEDVNIVFTNDNVPGKIDDEDRDEDKSPLEDEDEDIEDETEGVEGGPEVEAEPI
tara:strand:+ start:9035 stop:11104 length:2070 start_codon:yes stop_codon:yes gene_type:complete